MGWIGRELVFYLVIAALVGGFLLEPLWIRIVCFVLVIPAAIFWVGWDWFVTVIKHGRTFRE